MFRDFGDKVKSALSAFFKNRILIIGVLLLIGAVLIIARLFQLQVVRGNDYYENYVSMTKKEVEIPAMRGNIYDRNGRLIAGNHVVYSVTISDMNYYTKSDGEFNEMLLRLLGILNRFDVSIVHPIPVMLTEENIFVFDGAESSVRRFIRDVYGKERIEELKEEGEDVYTYDAETVMDYLMKRLYNFSSKWKGASDVSKDQALQICNIRYALSATAFTRYISTTIASDISPTVQAAVMEAQKDLMGVNIEQNYERVYNDSKCFSSIIGYVGSITIEEIEELNAEGGSYAAGDVIGKEGVESYYESYLQGTKGKKIIYVNNTGMVMSEEIIEEPVQGNDIYLSIDYDITVAAYNVMEQQLAGIIVNHLYEFDDYDPEIAYENSAYMIPIRDVYFQMINNNILSMRSFTLDTASETEKEIYRKFVKKKELVKSALEKELLNKGTTPLNKHDEYMQSYIRYMYSFLSSSGYLISENIDTADATYKDWKAGEISLSEFMMDAMKKGWVDLSMLNMTEKYQDVDTCYNFLVDILLDEISLSFGDFDKLVYSELIHNDVIGGCEIGRAMFDQGMLKMDEDAYKALKHGGNKQAFDFFRGKIMSMELLPSQIALDPCSAGLVLTNPNSGDLLSVVSYPGYDANQINDAGYYNRLINDKSSPLYSRATQSKLAPGSTFKMVTATAALQEGYLQPVDQIECTGVYGRLDGPKCWIYRLQNKTHGPLDTVHALGQSCNVFFYELGYRFSTNAAGQYSPSLGISVINKYASMYGFNQATGIETTENVCDLTSELPVTSAIGQGTFAFTTISLARYVTAIASSGNVYEMKLLKEISDKDGNEILSYEPVILNHLDFPQSTWDILHEGMYTVVHEDGSRAGDFDLLRYDYAAKSGSAQENRFRAEHGWYVSYGPYDNISYAMAVQIPNGYSSGNAALICKGVYEYLEGDVSLEAILDNSASSGSVNDILD